jgi:hypothetical protein
MTVDPTKATSTVPVIVWFAKFIGPPAFVIATGASGTIGINRAWSVVEVENCNDVDLLPLGVIEPEPVAPLAEPVVLSLPPPPSPTSTTKTVVVGG